MDDRLTLPMLIAIWLSVLAIGLVIQAILCWLTMNCFKALPPEHRKMEPAQVWLLMIPLFNLVWNFFVFPRLSDSFRSYFDGKPDEGVTDDCGRKLGMAYAICAAASVIPCVGFVAWPAALVIVVVFLVKANELRARVLNSM
jgi:hypothetical protein